jgi:bifunctional UDP-N-acetylglucosamine pyrophosphorylase/glucosamine-1-phosphate N-acetyltransferase
MMLPCLSSVRPLGEYVIGNIPFQEHHRRTCAAIGGILHLDPAAWIDGRDAAHFDDPELFVLTDANGAPLAWRGEILDSSCSKMAEHSFLISHPWDLLRANEQYVGALTEDAIQGDVHPAAVIEGVVHLGSGSRILPGVYIEGNVVIGSNCKIGPNCYLRGNTSIGDGCHIGQSVEIKNCLILSKTNVGHLSYVGDSVLGDNVNFGAGTTVSNLRHDGKNHRSMVDGILIDTGRRKFGTIVGDGVHTGIHTSIYPGRKLWPGATTIPGEVVTHDR